MNFVVSRPPNLVGCARAHPTGVAPEASSESKNRSEAYLVPRTIFSNCDIIFPDLGNGSREVWPLISRSGVSPPEFGVGGAASDLVTRAAWVVFEPPSVLEGLVGIRPKPQGSEFCPCVRGPDLNLRGLSFDLA
jgi:hypothetical protein